MENEKKKFESQGLKVAALSYDSGALLADFARRKAITYPLLADPDSRVIRAFGILNENFPKDHDWFGVPFPGTYIVNEKGIVSAKYFEEDHRDRYTAANVFTKTFGSVAGDGWSVVETPHLKLRMWATDTVLRAGSRVNLVLEVELKPKMHVYAPGVQPTYKPIDWTIGSSTAWQAHKSSFPAARTLRLEVIDETVPVYEGSFRLTRDLTIGQQDELRQALAGANDLTIGGSFRYQACDDRQCFPPVTVPLAWKFQFEAHDGHRVKQELRRRPKKNP